MDLAKVIAELRAELENLDLAIASLERIAQRGPRRGRPPQWLGKARSAAAAEESGTEAQTEKPKPKK